MEKAGHQLMWRNFSLVCPILSEFDCQYFNMAIDQNTMKLTNTNNNNNIKMIFFKSQIKLHT